DAPTTDETGRIDKTGNLTKAAGNYTLSLFKVGMKAIYFCNNVPYAYRLEMGHSTQAPGGMVRITAAEFQRYVEEAVREVTKCFPILRRRWPRDWVPGPMPRAFRLHGRTCRSHLLLTRCTWAFTICPLRREQSISDYAAGLIQACTRLMS